MRRILIDTEKCMGCKNCSISCIQSHRTEGTVYDIDLTDLHLESRNTILTDSQKRYKPLFCRHCSNPACAKSCMSGAMVKDAATGHVQYDPEKCGQCFMCVMHCPFGVLKPDRATSTYVVKCDFCADQSSQPQCVRNCPTGAIRIEEVTA
ncbi:MAG: 4Fe-4S binding protein [Defluviitaleaceae bacterium]|nr:4Fe-4S binding protein [Defluviitaleaceae bacterium]